MADNIAPVGVAQDEQPPERGRQAAWLAGDRHLMSAPIDGSYRSSSRRITRTAARSFYPRSGPELIGGISSVTNREFVDWSYAGPEPITKRTMTKFAESLVNYATMNRYILLSIYYVPIYTLGINSLSCSIVSGLPTRIKDPRLLDWRFFCQTGPSMFFLNITYMGNRIGDIHGIKLKCDAALYTWLKPRITKMYDNVHCVSYVIRTFVGLRKIRADPRAICSHEGLSGGSIGAASDDGDCQCRSCQQQGTPCGNMLMSDMHMTALPYQFP